MGTNDVYGMDGIRNRTAEAVWARVEKLLQEDALPCGCRSCVADLVAFALNRVRPRYTTSILGDLHPDAAQSRRAKIEIDLAIEAGLRRLREHPHHD